MLNQDYKEILYIFLEEKVDFIVVGAYALAAHGIPRSTGDIDIFIKPDRENSIKVYRSLARFGAPLKNIEAADFEKQGTIFQIGVIPRRIDIINKISGVTFNSAFIDRKIIKIENLQIPVISVKMLIKNKESTGRDKDKIDATMLRKHYPDL